MLFWKEDSAVSSADNTGQGDQDQAQSLTLIEDGNVILRGKVLRTAFPSPNVLQNAIGTVTFNLDIPDSNTAQAPIKMSADYRFEKVTFEYSEKTETTWDITIVGNRVTPLVFSGFNNNGTNPTFASIGTGNKYLYAGRSKTVDPYFLVDRSVQRFNVWGIAADTDAAEVTAVAGILAAYSTPPQSNEQVYTSEVVRRSSGVVTITVLWRQRTTAQDQTFPVTSSGRYTIKPYTDAVGFLFLLGTNNLATQTNILANSSFNTWNVNPYLFGLRATMVTPSIAKGVWQYLNPGVQIRGSGAAIPRTVSVRNNSTNGTLDVFLSINVAYGTGRRRVVASPVQFGSALGRRVADFTITRHIEGTVLPDQNPATINGVTLPQLNSCNNGSFLGSPAGTVMYLGVKFSATYNLLSGGASMIVVYSFHLDSAGIVAGAPQVRQRPIPVFGDGVHAVPTGLGWQPGTNNGTSSSFALGFPFGNLFLPSQQSFASFSA